MKNEARAESELILNHFGKEAQILKMGEECSELSATIFQSLCATKDKKENEHKMYGELADVYNLMKQMLLVFDADRIMTEASIKRQKCIVNYINK